jgi:hypothetical protein
MGEPRVFLGHHAIVDVPHCSIIHAFQKSYHVTGTYLQINDLQNLGV